MVARRGLVWCAGRTTGLRYRNLVAWASQTQLASSSVRPSVRQSIRRSAVISHPGTLRCCQQNAGRCFNSIIITVASQQCHCSVIHARMMAALLTRRLISIHPSSCNIHIPQCAPSDHIFIISALHHETINVGKLMHLR